MPHDFPSKTKLLFAAITSMGVVILSMASYVVKLHAERPVEMTPRIYSHNSSHTINQKIDKNLQLINENDDRIRGVELQFSKIESNQDHMIDDIDRLGIKLDRIIEGE